MKLSLNPNPNHSTMKKIALHWQIIIALILGILYSYLAISQGWMKFTLYYLRPFGDIFIRLLKMLAIPLVLFSIIKGVAGLSDISRLLFWDLKRIVSGSVSPFQ